MKLTKIVAGVAVAGGLAAGAVVVGAGVANADPGPGLGPVPTDWRPGPPPWHGDRPGWGGRPGWDGPGQAGWAPPGPPVPFPGGWNGGLEPNGGVCLFNLCV